jgi:hypothetical protein
MKVLAAPIIQQRRRFWNQRRKPTIRTLQKQIEDRFSEHGVLRREWGLTCVDFGGGESQLRGSFWNQKRKPTMRTIPLIC